jgi:tryptophan synthase beta chain
LVESGRVKAGYAFDSEVFEALEVMCRTEGLIPALETAHAIAYMLNNKREFGKEELVVLNFSGRGDKDLDAIMRYFHES